LFDSSDAIARGVAFRLQAVKSSAVIEISSAQLLIAYGGGGGGGRLALACRV